LKLYLHTFNFFNNLSIKNCDHAVSISNFLRKVLKKETGIDSKIEYCKISKKKFHKGINSNKIRTKLSLGKKPVLLYVGRISPHKGIHLLIEAFNIIRKTVPDVKLIIAGKHTFPNYTKKLHKLADKNVIFAGFVPDEELPYYYAACNIYTTASLWEGFDIPIVEAFYTGKPSVAFDIGSHKEVLKKGKLVKPKDINGFAKAVISLLEP